MTASGFARSLPPVLVYEGGKVDDPRDPGGRTNQGIIQRVYNAWRKAHGQSPADVYDMTNTERDAIYRSQFWDAVQGDKLPDGVDFVTFDGAVNSGPVQSIKWLQRALGVNADGVLGTVTFAALAANTNHVALVDAIVDRREAFLKALKTFKTFGKGWMARTAKVRALGRSWAAGHAALAPTTSPPPSVAPAAPKAVVADAKTVPSMGAADVATGGGIGSGTLAVTVNTLKDTVSPYAEIGSKLAILVVVLAVISAVLTIGGLAWRWWASRKKAAVADAMDRVPGVQ